jgi:hypothetical protein
MANLAATPTDRQELAWQLRKRGWSIQQIGRHLGITESAASRLLGRMRHCDGPGPRPRKQLFKRRVVRPVSLSIYRLP